MAYSLLDSFRRWYLHLLLAGVAAYVTDLAASEDAPQESSSLFSCAIARDGDLLLVPVNVDGGVFQFCLDTGCTGTIFDVTIKPYADRRERPAVINGRDVGLVKTLLPRNASVGDLPLKTECLETDLSWVRRASGQPVYGYLGMDFLKNYRLTIDPDVGIMTLSASSIAGSGQRLQLTFDDEDRPCAGCLIPDWEVEEFLIDTGFAGIASASLPTSLSAKLSNRRIARANGPRRKYTSFEGERMADSLSIDTVICGRFEHHGMSVMVTENTPPTLGMAFLVRYVVTMDFPKREMWLRPSRRFGDRELVDLSGLCLMKDAERIIVAVVIPQSPAFIADVQAGDELMSVGRRKASELRLHEMRLMLCEPDRTVPIEFQRDGKPSEVGLRLKQWW